MNYVYVKFSGTVKNYLYKTKLNLIEGATYKIVDVFFLLIPEVLAGVLDAVFSSFIGDLLSSLYQPEIDSPRRCR